jgi:hypothetical protein
MARGCWRTPIEARSTSCSKTAMVGPAGGTRYGQGVSSAGMRKQVSKRLTRAYYLARKGLAEILRWTQVLIEE